MSVSLIAKAACFSAFTVTHIWAFDSSIAMDAIGVKKLTRGDTVTVYNSLEGKHQKYFGKPNRNIRGRYMKTAKWDGRKYFGTRYIPLKATGTVTGTIGNKVTIEFSEWYESAIKMSVKGRTVLKPGGEPMAITKTKEKWIARPLKVTHVPKKNKDKKNENKEQEELQNQYNISNLAKFNKILENVNVNDEKEKQRQEKVWVEHYWHNIKRADRKERRAARKQKKQKKKQEIQKPEQSPKQVQQLQLLYEKASRDVVIYSKARKSEALLACKSKLLVIKLNSAKELQKTLWIEIGQLPPTEKIRKWMDWQKQDWQKVRHGQGWQKVEEGPPKGRRLADLALKRIPVRT